MSTITINERQINALDHHRLCVSCERSLAAIIQTFEDGQVFPVCANCLQDMAMTTLVPIIPIQL